MLALAVACGAASLHCRLLAQFSAEAAQQRTLTTIHADGSCQIENKSTQARAALEQQIRMTEQLQNMPDSDDAEALQKATTQTNAVTNSFTDEELKTKVLEMREEQFGALGADAGEQVQVEVNKDNVIVTTQSSFASIEEMLKSPVSAWGGEIFANVRIEQDTNGHLRVTYAAEPGMKRYFKSLRSAWKMSGMRNEFKLVLPGKILSSGLNEVQENATGFTVDAKKDESLDAYLKLMDAPTVITAERGGLTIKEPLDSKKLRRAMGQRDDADKDLPLTEGGEGFVAQPEGLMTTTIHVFPEGKEYFKEGNGVGNQPGTMVTAKVFAPKGRTLQSLSGVRLLKATDDKGRAIEAAEDENEVSVFSSSFSPGGAQENASIQVQLRLQLPLPDAQAIDELNAEAVAVTAGAWKEMALTNITEKSTNEFDLGAVLAGAKLTLKKVVLKNNMLLINGQFKGPPTVRRLDVQVKNPSAPDQVMGNANEVKFNAKGAESTRSISINASLFSPAGGSVTGPFTLQIRFPEDLRREKISIKLKGLDLL
jgi:formylmethanofuran dehydrogenase subunit D